MIVSYLNVRGLTKDKFETVTRILQERKIDIMFLAETWYIDQENLTKHPLFFSSTILPVYRTDMRQKGGIVCLVRPGLGNICLASGSSEHHVIIQYMEFTYRHRSLRKNFQK
jgi:hypothetical protein